MPSDASPAAAFQAVEAKSLTNVSQLLKHAATQVPEHTAVAVAGKSLADGSTEWSTISYAELETLTDHVARGLIERGIPAGTRLALLVRPGIEFIALVFGLMRAGMVQVLIDPGMGRSNMIRCLASTRPEGFVAIPAAQAVRCLLRRRFPDARYNITVGRRWFWGDWTYRELLDRGRHSDLTIPETRQNDPAAVIFTTGSTGPPKGVSYTHQMFVHQATQVRDYYQIQPGGVDLSGFPLFALFNVGMGTTTVIPRMDPTRPADVHPPDIIEAVRRWKATQSFGSPALWNTVSRYCEQNHVTLPTLKRVFSAGAPVPPHVIRRVKGMIHPDGEIYTPYGATEALPIASNQGSQILQQSQTPDQGTCVGHRFSEIQWRIISIDDGPLADIQDTSPVPEGQIGELMVTGPVVSQAYINHPQANQLHKVRDGDRIWHRMGDLGYLDRESRFWFCGRKSHRVIRDHRTWYTVPTEGIYNQHPSIYRSALVGVGDAPNQIPVLVAQPWPEHYPKSPSEQSRLSEELLQLGRDQDTGIERILLIRDMPVDIRHNSKIFREKLSVWAARKLGNRR